MYISTRFIGIERGKMNYLFFLLTEDYIEAQDRIRKGIEPMLLKLSRDIGSTGALVKPFRNYEKETLVDVFRKNWTERERRSLTVTPGILIIDKDFDDFDPKKNKWLHIPLRDLLAANGDVLIFELNELFDKLIEACKQGNLLEIGNKKTKKTFIKEIWNSMELKPGAFGCSIDLKRAIQYLLTITSK